jgi:hypothetical protein
MKRNEILMDVRAWPLPRWAIAVALAAVLAGCGGKSPVSGTFYPVKGKVTLPDGKPLSGVRAVFSGPVTSTSTTTESDGRFAFKGEKEGLPEGDYQVRLEVAEAKGATKKPTLPFPSRYLDEGASGLTAKVTAAGPNDFDFKLTKGDADESSTRGARGQGRGGG